MTAAVIEEPGVIRHVGSPTRPITIGEWNDQPSERLRLFADFAQHAGLKATLSEQIHVDVSIKFVAMVTVSAITALTRLPIRTLAATPESRQLMREGMEEIMAVAAAQRYTLPHGLPDIILEMADGFDPNWKTSMCNDLEAGKPIELEFTSGSVHRLGLELGVPTPIHAVFYRALKHFAS